jgi:hypothetical protein
MSTDYRALCAELVEQLQRAINDHGLCLEGKDALMFRARAALAQPYSDPTEERRLGYLKGLEDCAHAALAQPEPVAPTDEDVTELFYRHMGEGSEVGFENAIAEALARWGTPANNTREENLDG